MKSALYSSFSVGEGAPLVVVGLVWAGLVLWFWFWFLSRGFRRQPPGMLRLALLDARGVPNGVLLTVALAVVMMAACTLVGLVTGRWAPGYVWGGWFGISAWGIGADALVTRWTPAAFTQQAYAQPYGTGQPDTYAVPASPPAPDSSPSQPSPDASY